MTVPLHSLHYEHCIILLLELRNRTKTGESSWSQGRLCSDLYILNARHAEFSVEKCS